MGKTTDTPDGFNLSIMGKRGWIAFGLTTMYAIYFAAAVAITAITDGGWTMMQAIERAAMLALILTGGLMIIKIICVVSEPDDADLAERCPQWQRARNLCDWGMTCAQLHIWIGAMLIIIHNQSAIYDPMRWNILALATYVAALLPVAAIVLISVYAVMAFREEKQHVQSGQCARILERESEGCLI